MEKQKEEVIETFQKVAECFGQIYRNYFDKNATPKLYLLEVHEPMELRKKKRLKLFAEDSIEREHLNNKAYSILFMNIKSWIERHRKFKERKDLTGSPEVQSTTQEMTSTTERRLTSASKTRSDQKRKSRRDKAEALRDIFLQSLPASVIFLGQDGRDS